MKFAFVGLGHAAEWLHLPAIRSLRTAEIVGGADPSLERRQIWSERQTGPVFSDPAELLSNTRPDIVVIASPPDSHAGLCRMALTAGAHVICEKPLVETVAEANHLLSLAQRTGRFVAVNQEFRYMPIFAAVRSRVGQAHIGQPVFIECRQVMDLPPWKERVEWRAAMPQRTLFEGGVHIVDLVIHLVGRLPRWVFATTSGGLDPPRPADAIHLVTLDFGLGLLGQISINRLSRSGTRYLDLRLDCEEASLRASYGGRAFVQIGAKRGQRPGIRVEFGPQGVAWVERGFKRHPLGRNARNAAVRATAELYRETVDALVSGVAPPTEATAARDSLRIIEAAYESARTGERVMVNGH
jgi:scyllo-inositol 2-dehydrogenase (NADP+)